VSKDSSNDSSSAPNGMRLEGAARNPLLATLLEGLAAGVLFLALTVLLNRVAPALAPSKYFIEFLAWMRPASAQLFYLVLLVALPVAGELLFRGLPYVVWRGAHRVLGSNNTAQELVFWLLGILGAVGFALLPYLFMRRLMEFTFFFPIGLFVVGLWSWNVLRTRGFGYSVLLMFVFNLVAIAALMMQSQPS
jgi:membrane protease YdiL (CAAX protease family)